MAAGIVLEGGDYAVTCANAPTTTPCGDRFRVRLTLPPTMQKAGAYPIPDTLSPSFVTTSAAASGCAVKEGTLTGQLEVLEVRADSVRARLLATNVPPANKTVLAALFCD